MNLSAQLRQLLKGPGPVVIPGAYDAFSAKLIERYGFPAAYLGGLATATALATAEPLLDMTEQLSYARLVTSKLGIPLIVDGHTGFGDPVHITRAVQEFESGGVAGIHVEDMPFPKEVHYFKGIKHLVPLEEMVVRLRAALAARAEDGLVIIARTDAYGAVGGSLDETLRRLEVYLHLGVDGIMPLVADLEDARQVAERFSGAPLIYISGAGKIPGGDPTAQEITDMGYTTVLYPDLGIAASVKAMNDLCLSLKQTGTATYDPSDHIATREVIFDTIGLPKFLQIEAENSKGRLT